MRTYEVKHAESNDSSKIARYAVFRKLLRDRTLSRGAFMLWHYLHDRKNKHDQCWPDHRTIAKDLRCKPHSLAKWCKQLRAGGYLAWEKQGEKHRHIYTVLFGAVLPEGASRKTSRVAPRGITPRCP
ncbi:MAG: helix-turn-helix domain-containing protein [Verrucomicrobiae bacterium]|nr:helix-turn-helix domain-containing protein [Verrucomicrobiae bacterium]